MEAPPGRALSKDRLAAPPAGGDARRFGRSIGSVALGQLVCQVLTFAATVVLARKLDPGLYGLFAFGFAFPSWFLLPISLALDEVLAIEVSATRLRANHYLTL